jgi:hypothetical protein
MPPCPVLVVLGGGQLGTWMYPCKSPAPIAEWESGRLAKCQGGGRAVTWTRLQHHILAVE